MADQDTARYSHVEVRYRGDTTSQLPVHQSEGTFVPEMTWTFLTLVLVILLPSLVLSVNWLEWWTYDGISGPSFWGLINPEWSLCNQGLR